MTITRFPLFSPVQLDIPAKIRRHKRVRAVVQVTPVKRTLICACVYGPGNAVPFQLGLLTSYKTCKQRAKIAVEKIVA